MRCKHTALTVVELKGVNHVLRDDPSDSVANYQAGPLSPQLVTALDAFVGGNSPNLAAMTDDKMLARIAALLRQAEGTDNAARGRRVHGRRATAGHRDVDRPRGRALTFATTRTKAQTPVQRTITIGNAGARGLRTYVQLFTVIAHANDVKCDVASNSTFVYAYGFAEDIDASHALYASLVMQMVRASEAYIVAGQHRPTPTITARHQLPARLRRPHRPAAGRGARAGAARSHQGPRQPSGHRYRVAEQGHRAEGLLPRDVAGARHLAGHQRDGGLLVGRTARG